jgi:undecaprenyldiphospho-muramoylpentapeptide beta-N-acetylglucosaminyltransferase
MKKIVLTGGGSAGHVTPNIALVPKLRELGFDILYIGSQKGIEKDIIQKENITFKSISSGKLRRYFDIKNFTDPFRVVKGVFDARSILKKYRPDIVFSKGGFVTVPVVLAAHMLKIPVVIHESDISPGLANKISSKYADKICCNFPETLAHIPKDKAVLTGCPIRSELLSGDPDKAREFTGLNRDKPVILVIGGSLGAVSINTAVRDSLNELLSKFNIIHICGKGNVDNNIDLLGYVQYEYVSSQLKDIFALADIVISRAGANAICELLALQKLNILVPLSAKASRGDQILNAASFKKQGFSYVLDDEELNKDSLLAALDDVFSNKDKYINSMQNASESDGVSSCINVITKVAKA